MKYPISILMLVCLVMEFNNTFSQENSLFIPLEIKNAYQKETRSFDGKPGKNYWQNTVDYKIQVTVIPAERLIDGTEEVVYYNNSPDEITKLVVRLYGDVFKKGNTRLLAIDERDLTEGVELKNVVINETSYDLEDLKLVRRNGTNISFILQDTLMPGSELTFKTSWKQKIPAYTTRRMGAYDSTTIFIGYWYPQIAVYDDIFGWDMLNYTFQTEFYNNLGNYDVSITVPDEYLVWATGTFSNPDQVLPGDIYERYQKARSSPESIKVVSQKDLEEGIHTRNNTWHFTAAEVTDFAFAMSDHHLWEAAIQRVDNREVLINAAYPNDTSRDFSGMMGIQKEAMEHFSEDFPGIPYPYEVFTTFISKEPGGMEFPMMANNGSPNRGVTIHELFHTYFPMYVRINERKWAWMDEGWADYNTAQVTYRFFKNDSDILKIFPGTPAIMGRYSDLPLITSSEFLGSNYGAASYLYPSLIYAILHQHLDDELFLKCYQAYIRRWAKKSPTPYDFFYTFENVSGQDLSWLWKPWFFEFGVVDLAIESFQNNKMTIVRKGNKPVPLFINVIYNNNDSLFITRSAGIWAGGIDKYQLDIPEYQNIKTILLNPAIADIDYLNNIYPSVKSLYDYVEIPDNIFGQYKPTRFGPEFLILEEDGIVKLTIPGYGFSRIIYPIDKYDFRMIGDHAQIKFKIDRPGNCSGMNLHIWDIILDYEKQK